MQTLKVIVHHLNTKAVNRKNTNNDNENNTKNVETVVPLKYLSNF